MPSAAAAQHDKTLLRFITCGSVDDGKSTLIGRVLYDTKALFSDQVAALEQASRRAGRRSVGLDFASVVDGLADEQAQGITIDVAYRFFATQRRKFIIADTPGHEHYTRNMVTGASTAEAAVILVDATQGLLTQTRRHSLLVHLLGIRHIVLAVNKMDLVDYRQDEFDRIVADYRGLATGAGIAGFTAIPMAALHGDNVAAASGAMPWYGGPHLLQHLEQIAVDEAAAGSQPFRMAVQHVADLDGRPACAGTIASGSVAAGEAVVLLPNGNRTTVERIVTMDAELGQAQAGQAVTLVLAGDVRPRRGDLICGDGEVPLIAERLEAMLVWLAADEMADRPYWLKIGTRTVAARIESVAERVDVNGGPPLAGAPLAVNDIGRCTLKLADPVAAIPYAVSRALGGFILIDQATNATVAAGMIQPV